MARLDVSHQTSPVMGRQADIGRYTGGAAGGVDSNDVGYVPCGVFAQGALGYQAVPKFPLFCEGQAAEVGRDRLYRPAPARPP